MSTTPQPILTAVLVCCLAAVSAAAQNPSIGAQVAAPANLAYVEGGVDLVHDGITERADPPMLLLEGDLVRSRNGRAEIVFADGTLLHLDFGAELEILGPERIRLLHGRALLRLSAAAARPYTVDTPAASVRFDSVGEYGVVADQLRGDLEVTVARGVAEIDDGTQRATVRGGQMVVLAGAGARPLFQSFNSARFDAFTQWSSTRTHGFAAAPSSAQLPYELRPYGPVLDQYGRWDYVAPHGYVWLPSVGVAWRPYYDGAWSHTRYGWTWHGRDRWAWPTHHYGRWGFNGSSWFWIPANIWGPAWVSWGFAPGYVSWSPLGWDGRPVIGFAPGYGYSPWRSWTVVPREHFSHRRPVRVHAIDGGRLEDRIRTSLIVQNTPPASSSGFAVSRGSVATPGTTGNVRRLDPDVSRRGNVRRPPPPASARQAPAPSHGETTSAAEAPDTAAARSAPARRITSVNRRAPSARVNRTEPDAPSAPMHRTEPDAPSAPVNRIAPDAPSAPVHRTEPDAPSAPSAPVAPDRSERGRARGGYAQQPPPESEGARAGNVRGASPRSEPRAESPRSGGAGDNGGARQRGGSAGAPAQGAPAQSAPPPSGGAVRRRPGA